MTTTTITTTITPAPVKVRLLKFGSKTCPACISMDRARLLERFMTAHPEVIVIKLDVSDEEGESPEGSVYDTNNELSDIYGVTTLPTLVFETLDGGELASQEGGLPMGELEKLYRAAKERHEASRQILTPAAP